MVITIPYEENDIFEPRTFHEEGGIFFCLTNKLIKFVKVLKSKWGSKTQMVPLNKNEIYHKVT